MEEPWIGNICDGFESQSATVFLVVDHWTTHFASPVLFPETKIRETSITHTIEQ